MRNIGRSLVEYLKKTKNLGLLNSKFSNSLERYTETSWIYNARENKIRYLLLEGLFLGAPRNKYVILVQPRNIRL